MERELGEMKMPTEGEAPMLQIGFLLVLRFWKENPGENVQVLHRKPVI
jgi:hypothetical protein